MKEEEEGESQLERETLQAFDRGKSKEIRGSQCSEEQVFETDRRFGQRHAVMNPVKRTDLVSEGKVRER
jgi:hypothetical protein